MIEGLMSIIGVQFFDLYQFEIGIHYAGGISGRYFVNAIALYVVPKLNVKSIHVIQVDPILLVLTNNHKGGVVPDMPGFFVEGEGIELFY